MMKIYLKIVMLFLVFTCMFALAACKETDEKRKQIQPRKIIKMNRVIFQKNRKILKQNQAMKKQQNHRLTQIRKIEHLIKNQLTTLKICLNSQKKEKYLMYHLEPIQGILKKLKKRGESK